MIDIEFIKRIKRRENLSILRKEVSHKWVLTKIKNHLERNDYLNISVREIQSLILDNDLFASFFIKDPSRQNISENIIGNFISKMENVNDFCNHSSSVRLFIKDGQITNTRSEGIKSIDFTWKTKKKKVFATQKYTKETGGAQDNQYNDVITFLGNCRGNKEHFFIAIVDGDYYTKTKMDTLKQYETVNIKVCSVSNLNEVLEIIE